VYAASVDGRRLTFDVYGVWRKNMIMNDRETGTLWQHATGEAVDGPLKGRRLEVLPGWETTWGELQTAYPRASFALEPERFTGVMPKPALMRALRITHAANLSGLSPMDKRLDGHEVIIGVVINGEAKAYPLAALRSKGMIADRLGGQDIELRYRADSDRVSIHTPEGRTLPYERQWWLGWIEFHPRSAVYQEK
jgi:hypothetical protein